METMHINENKKGAKGIIFSLVLFCVLGGTIIFLALKNEPAPIVIGQEVSDIQKLVNTDDEAIKASTDTKSSTYEIKEKVYSDKSNPKIKCNIILPVISINGELLDETNKKIADEYTKLFDGFKTQMASSDSKYTYKVTHNVYENIVGNKKIVSISFYQRIQDDAAGKNSMEKVDAINIDIDAKKEIDEVTIAQEMLGKEYKTIIKTNLRNYVVSKKMLKDEEFVYALTGYENFYVKDSKLHIIFNEGTIVDAKYGILDIIIQ
ncbi:MAG: hypothetical protein RSB76_03000 [Clostridia bacterium]